MWTLGALDAAARCSLKSFSHVHAAYCMSDYEGVRMTLRSSAATAAHLEGVLLDEELEALDAVGGLHGAPGGSGGTLSCEHSRPDPTRAQHSMAAPQHGKEGHRRQLVSWTSEPLPGPSKN